MGRSERLRAVLRRTALEQADPFASNLAHECHSFTDNYEKCTWQFEWRVSIGVPRPVPPFMWKDGLAYRLRFCIKNSAYTK